MRLGSRDGAVTGDWSKTGGAGEPQPDNREFKVRLSDYDVNVSALLFKVEGKHDEACIAMLNNFYGDGAVNLNSSKICRLTVISKVWHDIACYHKKWFICEDSDKLMDFARTTSPEHAPRI